MKRETVVGLVVLGLVLAGVYWSRLRPGTHEGASAGRASHDMALPGAHGDGSATDDAALPDVTATDASVDVEGVRVTLSVAPRPPVAFATKHFRVRAEANGVPVALAQGQISFEMKMPMGDHRYSLVAASDGWQEAEVVLPFCPSGNPRWYATVTGSVDGRAVAARFRVDLTKPGAESPP